MRLDIALSKCQPLHSRSYLGKLIKEGAVLLDGRQVKPNRKVKGGETVAIDWPEPEVIEALPEQIPLSVLHEDADLIVINKPSGMPAHPSSGHTSGTLVNALLGHCQDLSSINGALRPGIVHRLDMNTTGAIVVAKNDRAHRNLQEQFAERTVTKRYLALCYGHPPRDEFSCEGRIGRHPVRRKEMTVMRGDEEGREAQTAFEVRERFKDAALAWIKSEKGKCSRDVFLVLAKPRTGRTHQIRVHLAKSGFPILADGMYGVEDAVPALGLQRHALHAWKLSFCHPGTGQKMTFEAPLSEDMQGALQKLQKGNALSSKEG